MSYPQYTQQPVTPTPGQQSSTAESSSMKENAAEAAQQGKQAVGQVAQSTTDRVGEVKDEAVRQARDLVGEAKSQVSQQAGQQHQALVSNLRALSSELDAMNRQNTQPGLAGELVSQAQQQVSGVASWLESREPGELLDEVRAFARRRPGTFLAGALVAGMVAGRFARGAVEVHTGDDDADRSGTGLPATSAATTAWAAEPTMAVPSAEPTVPATDPFQPGYSAPTYSAPETGTQGSPTNGSWQ